jgi:hypothetical protein
MSIQAASGSTPVYADRYENLALTRDDGVLVLRLHTVGGPAVFTGQSMKLFRRRSRRSRSIVRTRRW